MVSELSLSELIVAIHGGTLEFFLAPARPSAAGQLSFFGKLSNTPTSRCTCITRAGTRAPVLTGTWYGYL